MYLSNKYSNWYDSIINNAKNRCLTGYFEKHHIIPRSLGGSDEPENLVNLTAREHFVCHLLLTKFTTGFSKHKMITAAYLMSSKSHLKSRQYSYLKEQYSLVCKLRTGLKNPFYGKQHSEESKKKMRLTISNSLTPERKLKIKQARTKWNHNQANKSIWLIADQIYLDWCADYKFSSQLEKKYNLKKYSLQNLVTYFKQGWIPNNDIEWVNWKSSFTK